ncbi:MAG: ABC transporter substrate-binding protein [Defluviitaleaceae bacterium]|nr:ABC transporter substrate-binding protein [Defluviitaleaceae bacterium]
MKKKTVLTMLLSAVLAAGVVACAAPQQPAQPANEIALLPSAQVLTNGSQAQVPLAQVPEAPNGSLVIATQNEAPTIAPARHITQAGGFINLMTHNSLFRVNYTDLQPVPDLIESYRALSDVLFEFTLREGILFHNGEEMTAYDVVASFYYVRQYPEARTGHLSALEAEVIDTYTFTIYTGEPNAALFFDLAGSANAVMPQSLIEDGNDFGANPVGSGPFVFDEWRFGDSMHLTAFANYFDTNRASRVKEVTWRIIPEGSSRIIGLETGEIDFVVEVPEADVPRLLNNSGVEVFMVEGTAYNMMLLNNSIHPFDNIVVRQAINKAVDQTALVAAAFDGLATPIREQVPVVFPGTNSHGVLPFDPEGARALLAEHNIDPATIGFDMVASSEERRRMAEVVQAQLMEIGIPTTITMNDHATTIQRSLDADYEALFGMWNASNLIPFMRGVYHGGIEGNPNRNRVNIPELNALIDQAIATIDADERNAVFEEASSMVNELVINVPTHLHMTIRAFNANLAAPELSAVGGLNLNMVYWK